MAMEFYPLTYVLFFNSVSARHKMEENKNEDEAEKDRYFRGKAVSSQQSVPP